jgi:hypothetical protein
VGPAGRSGLALLNDEPVDSVEADKLSAGQAALQLSALLLASRRSTPFTLAVDASWGMGKSSLMRLVDTKLRETRGVHTVWYNAWSSTGADVLEGLIKSVLAQFDRNVLRRALRRVSQGGGLVKAARALSLLAAGPLGVGGLVDELWRSLSVDAAARNDMREALRQLVAEWTAAPPGGAPGRLLVVFIDDLDRCSEQTVLALCEALKVYLDVSGLAFVIGCDRDAMSPDGMLGNLAPAGTAFMEKVFQTSYRIPAPGSRDIENYVLWCAERAGIAYLLDPQLVELLGYRAARNPRRVKRLVNGLLLEAHLNPIWAGISTEAVIRTLLLQYLYSDFYTLMTRPGGSGFEGYAAHEFRGYLAVRALLRSESRWSPAEHGRVVRLLGHYGVPVSPTADPAARPVALAALEGALPDGFPALAADPAFLSLLDGLLGLGESEVVLQRLRHGLEDPADPEEPPGRDEERGGGPGEDGDLPMRWGDPPQPPERDRQPGGRPQATPDPSTDPSRAAAPTGVPAEAGAGSGPPRPDQPAGAGADRHTGGDYVLPGPADRGHDRAGAPARTDASAGGRQGTPSQAAPSQGMPSQVAPRAERRSTGGHQSPRPAGPADPVSSAFDPSDPGTFPEGYLPPPYYAQHTPSSPRPVPRQDHRDGHTDAQPVVVVVGFDGADAGRVAYALRTRGSNPDFAFNPVLWDGALGRGPQAVLCHVAAFGRRDEGFALIRAARAQGYRAPVVLYTPRLTPNERLAAGEVDADITNDTGTAVDLVLAALDTASGPPQSSPPGAR